MSLSGDEKHALEVASREAIAFRQSLGARRVTPAHRPADIGGQFNIPLPEAGAPADAVISELARDAADGLHGHGSPRFFGYVLGGSMPVGIAADALVSAWGQNSASTWESPSVTSIERAVCHWCVDLMNLPRDAGVGIVTGATVANTQGIMAGRNFLLRQAGWDVEADGLFGAPSFPVLVGADAHSSPLGGLRYAGLGQNRATTVETDDQGRIRVDRFAESLDRCDAPPLVVLQAGQINTGAFDPFAELIPMVHARGGWVHVDGAFGLWLNAAPALRHRLAGVETADSWAVDLHKMLNAPFDAALCIVRDRATLVASMTARGAYLPSAGELWEPADSTMELSRRARGVPSYAILKHLGRSGVEAMMTRFCDLARRAADQLSQIPGIEVLNEVASNQVIFACESDELTEAVLAKVQERGHVYPSHGEWRDRKVIRISVTNYATREPDIDLLVHEIGESMQGLT